ncbi:CGNR zinc finger domain-containing protein [Streptomyces sp. PTM05]|uniref:CGNR zinc finger domain-containing protein n=1 Tax=Streptantibioticus parmotrematis TaxID=2873249 RepID=A0ABS7QNB9_9ACTN|nr:CGNR zinc finger domain-containing protein [Streptantibioticus parmotrematis]MBY8884675.1 CGNR zinc finger domain-containing protein [Streptantibioticus parmotrematis]
MNDPAAAPGDLAFVEALVNTLDIEEGTDALDTAEGREPFGLAERDAPAARELREALRGTLLAHAGHREADGDRLGPLLAGAPLVVVVDPADGSASLRPADPASLTGRVAAAIASCGGSWTRLKACEAADCRWAYYDRSPAGRRRWCSMAVCGSRAKMRAYRDRRGAAS